MSRLGGGGGGGMVVEAPAAAAADGGMRRLLCSDTIDGNATELSSYPDIVVRLRNAEAVALGSSKAPASAATTIDNCAGLMTLHLCIGFPRGERVLQSSPGCPLKGGATPPL